MDCPQLRPHLTAAPYDSAGRHFVIFDQLRLSDSMIRVTPLELEWVQLFNGQRTLREIQTAAMRTVGGQLLPLEIFTRLALALEEALFLEGPRFRHKANLPVRPPACIGAYESDPDDLRRSLQVLFTHPHGAGLPGRTSPDGSLRAALVPHIDYGRGGVTYTHAFKEVFERTDAALFVIIGTSHYSRHRFTLTRKHFQTPLGIVPTDQEYVDQLAACYGHGLFDDELLAHLPEHSIELEVVFLQYLYEGKRDIRIVPLVVGSFHDCILNEQSPRCRGDIRQMVEALRFAERESKEPICYLISGDLAHIGPKFGDSQPLGRPQLEHSRARDQAILAQTAKADADAFFEVIEEEGDERRICGLPPTWLVLEAARPGSARVLHYDQHVHPQGVESVSFASAAFYR